MRIKTGPNSNFNYRVGALKLAGYRYLKALPEGLHVSGDLILNGCTSLVSLPSNLRVCGSLFLKNCASLTSLPDNLRVSHSIQLQNCVSLRSLPVDIVANHICLDGCTSLLSDFPHCVYSHINFTNDRIMATLRPDIRGWCEENDIELDTVWFLTKPYEMMAPAIHDPAQLMHYRLRWG